MTVPQPHGTSCPNCGATVRFLWAQAVQTTCVYCKAILVRRDLDLETVGQQAEFPVTGTPIQIGTEGSWREQRFQVVGRITYEFDRGRWNEWHCRVSDGNSAWLSDAQLEYAMTITVVPDGKLPQPHTVMVGEKYVWNDAEYEVSTITFASYVGTEGELPFTSASRDRCQFVDLQNEAGDFATVDFSAASPVLYLGEYCTFDALSFSNLREFDGW